jgi:alkylation response protein AidB-like acyl-CoA dehydrogenase
VNGPHSRFTNFRVPAANVLAKPGEGAQIVEQTFGMSAAIVGAMCVGVMRHAFEAALAFCKEDYRGGKVPVLEHQSVSDRLIDAKMKIEAARALVWKAMCVLESKDEKVGWQAKLEIALEAKIWCSEQVTQVVLGCMSVVGMYVATFSLSCWRCLEDMLMTRCVQEVVCYRHAIFDAAARRGVSPAV